jgi:aminomuconate-semialdehyde/2-hydroxymuconate-6-semialdehyde dehydrogenase
MSTPFHSLFIDGALCRASTDETFDDIDPTTGEVWAKVALAGRDDVDRAVSAAKKALKGPWGKLSANARADLLEKVADRIFARSEDFLRAEIRDTGKPAGFARVVDIPRGAANFRIFAQVLRNATTEMYETPTDDGAGALMYSLRQPLGVIGVICPWNLPLLLMTWKVAPALAAGNTVVVKPSEETPATASLLGEVMREVGIPEGVFNVVHGFGPGSAGEFLVEHPDVRAITFTGESKTGSAIMAKAARDVKPISFELGGKNPALVFADCDFDKAIAGTLRSVFANCGQVCLCSERVYVERPIFERFVEALARGARALVPGDPWSASTTIGPLISETHKSKVLAYYALAREEGATFVTGGDVPLMQGALARGSWISPTIVTGLSDDARTNREEIFGPICHVSPFDDEGEVVARANDTEYGLCAAVWTDNLSRAHRVARELDVGMAWVNSWYLRDLRTPFGGAKRSGIGREGGVRSLEFYSDVKTVCIKL